jgi:hypothetical protein
MRGDEIAQFWEKKRAANQHILDMIEAGAFKAGDGSVIDAETLAEVQKWAAHRVEECAARIAERLRMAGTVARGDVVITSGRVYDWC